MIPNALIIGFIGGIYGRGQAWFVLGAAVTWPILLAVSDVGTGSAIWIAGAALAAVNAVVGIAVGRALRWLLTAGRRSAGSGTSRVA